MLLFYEILCFPLRNSLLFEILILGRIPASLCHTQEPVTEANGLLGLIYRHYII